RLYTAALHAAIDLQHDKHQSQYKQSTSDIGTTDFPGPPQLPCAAILWQYHIYVYQTLRHLSKNKNHHREYRGYYSPFFLARYCLFAAYSHPPHCRISSNKVYHIYWENYTCNIKIKLLG